MGASPCKSPIVLLVISSHLCRKGSATKRRQRLQGSRNVAGLFFFSWELRRSRSKMTAISPSAFSANQNGPCHACTQAVFPFGKACNFARAWRGWLALAACCFYSTVKLNIHPGTYASVWAVDCTAPVRSRVVALGVSATQGRPGGRTLLPVPVAQTGQWTSKARSTTARLTVPPA